MSRLIEIALSQYGLTEIPGKENNPGIVKYFKEIGFTQAADDETAWCSAFVNWCAKQAGLPRSNDLLSRSWLAIGLPVTTPRIGDIAVFWRDDPKSWKGHVGFFIRDAGHQIFVLGGNQQNSVCILPYPISKLLGYRRIETDTV